MVYDSTRKVFLIFGGRSSTGYDFETLEWDPAAAHSLTAAPRGRAPASAQHGVREINGNVLLFGAVWPIQDPPSARDVRLL